MKDYQAIADSFEKALGDIAPPVAQKMWKQGIRTTDWVEMVKGEL